MKIELLPHPAKAPQRDMYGDKLKDEQGEVILKQHITDQMMIAVNGQGVGYCGITPNSPISLTRWYGEEFTSKIKKHVDKINGGNCKVNMPPRMTPEIRKWLKRK